MWRWLGGYNTVEFAESIDDKTRGRRGRRLNDLCGWLGRKHRRKPEYMYVVCIGGMILKSHQNQKSYIMCIFLKKFC